MTAGATDPHIGLVVEGRGELGAVPIILRAHLQQARNDFRDLLGKPVPCHGRNKALVKNGLEGYVVTAAGRPGCLGVLVILDAERDAACVLGPNLLSRAKTVTSKPVAVALAESKYESWLVASVETLGLEGLQFPVRGDPVTAIRTALKTAYVKPTWQPRLSARMDLELATGRAPSLKRMFDRFDSLVSAVL